MAKLYKFDQGAFREMQTLANQSANTQWTSGDQTVPNSTFDQFAGIAKFSTGIGAISLFGRHKFQSGVLGWDYIIGAARRIEEYSPGRVFRTFQLSHLLSPLESASKQYRYFSPAFISRLRQNEVGRQWLQGVSDLVGQSVTSADIVTQGFRFEAGQLRTGKSGGQLLLERASVVRAPTGFSTRFQEAYARSLAGGPISNQEAIFATHIKYLNQAGDTLAEPFMFTGGRSRLQSSVRYLSGYGTSLVERLNQLARAPFELPVISNIMNRLPLINRLKLHVTPSTGLKTLGKITAKLGILGSAAYMAYQEIDYAARNSELLDNTILSEGTTAAIASMWTKGQVGLSTIADWTGGHDYREWQEKIASGSTELSKLIAFPLLGAAGGLLAGYGNRISKQLTYRRAGLDIVESSLATHAEDAFFRNRIYGSRIPNKTLDALSSRAISLVEQETERKLSSWTGRAIKGIANQQLKPGFVGRFLRGFGKLTPGRFKWMAGAAAGAALVLPFVPGALVPSDRPEKLEAMYSGAEKVPIRKGRWWEMGRSPFEGQRIDRFSLHWYPKMLARAKEKAIWGENAPSPLQRWYIENFTYELEKKHYQDRPYPITGTAFEDIPFLGPILAGTVGQLVKPAELMHKEQWMNTGEKGTEVIRMPLAFGEKVLPGELEEGVPISPYSTKGILGEQAYRFTEMFGLPGFTMTAIKDAITGTGDLFDQEMQLESARRMYGAEREYWDKEIGGGLGTTELVRRLYPHRRRQIELYNPIRNTMPEWLPGPGEKSADFLHGDPFVKVPEGEMRLPGPGYAALHPELKGVAPEDYPLFHRFAILADLAPYTETYKDHLIQMRSAAKYKQLSEEEIEQFKIIQRQVSQRKVRKEFTPYQYKDSGQTPIEEVLARVNQESKEETDGPSWFERTIGTYWEQLTHNAETPLEYLTPISPAAKLIHARTAVEDYERTQVWGTQNAFWGHPIRDFFGPTADVTAHALGSDSIPTHIQEKRDLEEYFDILKYVKYTRLKRAAQFAYDRDATQEYESKRRETLFGINPFTYNFSHLYRSLPRADRDYFADFIEADTEERAKIFQMVPENERALYVARWKLKDANDLQLAIKKNLLTEKQIERAEEVTDELFKERMTEGMPKNDTLWKEFISTRLPEESYPDWYRRVYLLEEKLDGKPLPGPDWVGWHPAVDLEDIKMKVVTDEGKNTYDYDLWPQRLANVARRPMIAQAVEAIQERGIDPDELRSRINSVLSANNIRATHVAVMAYAGDNTVDIDLEHDRSSEIETYVKRGMLN